MIFFSSVRGDIDAYRSLSLSCQGGEVSFSGGHCDNLRSPLSLVSRTLSLAVSLSALRYSLQSAVSAARLRVSVNFSFPAMVYFVAISLWGDAGLYRLSLIAAAVLRHLPPFGRVFLIASFCALSETD